MKYLCLIYHKEKEWDALSPSEVDAIMADYQTFTAEVQKAGQYVGGEELQPTSSATTVRVRDGKLSTTDGPFAETKEQLGGYYLIEARDQKEAEQIAARIPAARTGSIEVRPVMDFSKEMGKCEEAEAAAKA